jgi:hypothetical protein
MLGNNPLPNFSNPKHPSRATTQPEPCTAQKALLEQPQPAADLPAENPPAAASPIPAKTLQKPSKPGLWNRLWRIPADWFSTWLPKRKAASGSLSVQTELALDKVTVIRNDLNEDDLEVVVGQKAEEKTEKTAQNEKVERENLTANP